MVLNALGIEHLVVEADGFILHASFIEWNGKAILFTAPSGTGKSTQAELWRENCLAEIINGDRAVVRLIEDKVYADGIPFSGSSVYCKNRTLPIAAIVYLQQSPVTSIRKMQGMEAFRKIWEGCTVNAWNQDDLIKVTEMVEKVVTAVPIYHLACTPDESAILALENELNKLSPTPKQERKD